MSTISDHSLLTESGFLKELASLDEGLTVSRRSPASAAVEARYEPLSDVSTPARTTPPGMFADHAKPAAAAVPEGPTLLGQVAAAAMFVLMMGVGAAGAAVIFRHQVERILANW